MTRRVISSFGPDATGLVEMLGKRIPSSPSSACSVARGPTTRNADDRLSVITLAWQNHFPKRLTWNFAEEENHFLPFDLSYRMCICFLLLHSRPSAM